MSLELVQPVPAQVPVGADVVLKVRASDAGGSDLRGGFVNVMAADGDVTARALTEYRDGCNETDGLSVKAPERLGAFTWRVKFPRQEIDRVAYEESLLPVSFETVPHQTSLAVWAVPSPVRIGERFRIKVGAKSSGACELTGAKVEILNGAGAKVGHGMLGDSPWPGTDALYWAEIDLQAPLEDGTTSWSVTFAALEPKLPHVGASTKFSFAVVKPPEHRLTVQGRRARIAKRRSRMSRSDWGRFGSAPIRPDWRTSRCRPEPTALWPGNRDLRARPCRSRSARMRWCWSSSSAFRTR